MNSLSQNSLILPSKIWLLQTLLWMTRKQSKMLQTKCFWNKCYSWKHRSFLFLFLFPLLFYCSSFLLFLCGRKTIFTENEAESNLPITWWLFIFSLSHLLIRNLYWIGSDLIDPHGRSWTWLQRFDWPNIQILNL